MSLPTFSPTVKLGRGQSAFRRTVRGRRFGRFGLSLPTIVLIAIGLGGPLVYLLFYSFGFFSFSGAQPSALAWTQFFTSDYYVGSIWQSLAMAGLTTGICLVVAYPIVLCLNATKNAVLRNVVLVSLFVPLFTSVVSRAYGWELLIGSNGLLDSILKPLGIPDPNLIYHFPGVIIALVHIELPFMVYPLLNSVRQIDPSLLQAAEDLGARPARRFRSLTLPLSLPGAVSGSQLVFALSIGAFSTASLLGGGRVRILATVIYEDVTNVRWPSAAVGCFVLLAITLAALGLFSLLGRLVRYLPIEGATATVSQNRVDSRSRGAAIGRVVWLVIVIVFMLSPLVLTVVESFSSVAYGTWPPPGLSLKWYTNLFSQAGLASSIGLSLVIAVIATVCSLIIGTAGALAVSRSGGGETAPPAASRALDLASMAPNVVPKVALGFAAYIFFNTSHLLPGLSGVFVGHMAITLPFVYIVMRGALARADRSLELAALDLGVGRIRAFFSTTIPQLVAGLASAAIFAFIISFDEVDMTIFMLPQGAQTVPVWMYYYLQRYQDPTLAALSTVLIAFTVLILLVGALVIRLGRRRTGETSAGLLPDSIAPGV